MLSYQANSKGSYTCDSKPANSSCLKSNMALSHSHDCIVYMIDALKVEHAGQECMSTLLSKPKVKTAFIKGVQTLEAEEGPLRCMCRHASQQQGSANN